MEALRLAHVSRTCGDVRAVKGVSVSFRSGELHALVGENGAGKSTLLKIAAGIMVPDEGEVFIEGKKLTPHSAAEAIKRGVGMVQQHFALVEDLSVLENLVLGAEPGFALGRLDFGPSAGRARKLLADLGFGFRLDTKVERLGVGDRQRVEIARVLFKKARTVILDEPTAVLTAYEAHALYGMLQGLARSGHAVVVVTHKLGEVVSYCDHVTVLRRGELISSRALGDRSTRSLADTQSIARDVMGGRIPDALPPTPQASGGSALVLKDVCFGRSLRGVSFELNAGEVVGVAGIEGNGQHELVRVIAGLDKPDSGLVWPKQEKGKRRASVVFEDRQREGLVLQASVKDNLLLGELGAFSSLGLIDAARVTREATIRRERSGLDSSDLGRSAGSFSGGNQQKIVMARAISRVQDGGVLVVAHPTRGVDLGAAHAIHAQILEVASAKKVAVLVLSSDLAELRSLAGRILVMAKGRIVAELPRTASDVEIGEHMLLDHDHPSPSLGSRA
ncbi:MAG: sugar ABC transporter ATP-binding protein [Polyangiaceae bacterium]